MPTWTRIFIAVVLVAAVRAITLALDFLAVIAVIGLGVYIWMLIGGSLKKG